MTDIDAALRRVVDAVGQAGAARVLKVSRSHVNHLLAGRKEFGPELAKRLGFKRVVEFQRIPKRGRCSCHAAITGVHSDGCKLDTKEQG